MTAVQNYGTPFQHTDNTLIYSRLQLSLKNGVFSPTRRRGYKYRSIARVTEITVAGKTPEDLAKCQMPARQDVKRHGRMRRGGTEIAGTAETL